MHTELRLAIWHTITVSHNRRREGFEEGRICFHAFFVFLIFLILFSYKNATNVVDSFEVSLEAICNDMLLME